MAYNKVHDKQWASKTPVKVTPAMARKQLARYEEAVKADPSKRNRSISQKHVNANARAMTEGQWDVNGETIKFDPDGILCDGQHRLLACIKSDTDFYTFVAYNVPRDSFATIDAGYARTATQTIQMLGVRYSSVIVAIITGIRNFMVDMPDSRIYASEERYTPRELREVYESDSKNFDEAAEFAGRNSYTGLMSTKLIGTLYYYLINVRGEDKDTVADFLSHINAADTVENNLENNLRKKLFELKGSNRKLDRVKLNMVVRTWNALATGTDRIILPNCKRIACLDSNMPVPQFESRQ